MIREFFNGRAGISGLLLSVIAVVGWRNLAIGAADDAGNRKQWIGTWATAAQPPIPGTLETYRTKLFA